MLCLVLPTALALPFQRQRRQATITAEELGELLQTAVPGVDFPAFSEIPDTNFECSAANGVLENGGYYADVEAGCQVFHICENNAGGRDWEVGNWRSVLDWM